MTKHVGGEALILIGKSVYRLLAGPDFLSKKKNQFFWTENLQAVENKKEVNKEGKGSISRISHHGQR